MANLHIDLPSASKMKSNAKKEDVIDSWEDDDLTSPVDGLATPTDGSGSGSGSGPPIKSMRSKDPALKPPPPTPISPPGSGEQYMNWSPAQVLGGGRPTPYSPPTPSTPTGSDREREQRRPEKTTATASRMIAAGLGIKAPKKTEEQKQYDRAVREQEIRRKNKEKEDREREREADEKLKAAVWDS